MTAFMGWYSLISSVWHGNDLSEVFFELIASQIALAIFVGGSAAFIISLAIGASVYLYFIQGKQKCFLSLFQLSAYRLTAVLAAAISMLAFHIILLELPTKIPEVGYRIYHYLP